MSGQVALPRAQLLLPVRPPLWWGLPLWVFGKSQRLFQNQSIFVSKV